MIRPVLFPLLLALGVLAGCAGQWATDYDPVPPEVARDWRLSAVRVSVPDTLTTSEDNTLAPDVDIVWHGDPPGDRRAQVRAIVAEGIRQGASGLRGRRPVVFEARVLQFHAVTPAAVAVSPGAVHDIRYAIRVVDARTGAVVLPAREIQADLAALVGSAAISAAVVGETQKVRITRHLARVTRGWLGLGEDVRTTFVSIGR